MMGPKEPEYLAAIDHFYFTSSADHETWLNQVLEDVLEPDLPIIDAHHHLWMQKPPPYLFREYLDDVSTGHRVIASVFAECHSMYRPDGPEAMRPVGESEFVARVAAMSESGEFGDTRVCNVMFGAANLSLGDQIDPVLEAHEIASGGRFRGIRAQAAYYPGVTSPMDRPHYLRQTAVRAGIARLAAHGLSLDIWVFHPQLDEVAEIAAAFPDLTIILNHFGLPILGGPFKGRTDEVFSDWRSGIERLGTYGNIYLKLGALSMRRADRSDPDLPPRSDDIARAWLPWTEVAINAFTPSRCMFESNFPVDKRHYSYPVLWNAFKKLASSYSTEEKQNLMADTARRAYRMEI